MKNKVLKRLFSFAVILVIALSLCFGFVSKEERITASADVPTDNLDPDITLFDIENYPSANYFDVTKITPTVGPNSIVDVSNGVVNSVVIFTTSSGYGTVSTPETLGDICPELKVGETYYLSAKSTAISRNYIYLLGAQTIWFFDSYLTITSSYLNSSIIFYGGDGTELNPFGEYTISEIMINKGTEGYPYFPYYYSFYNAGVNSGYSDGFDAGKTEGYEEGKIEGFKEGQSEGLAAASYGFLYDPEVVIRFNNVGSTGENRILNTTVSSYTDSGFSFSQFRERALTAISPYTSCQSIEVTLRLSTVTTMNRFALDLYSDYLSKVFIDDNSDLFYAQLDHSEKPFYHISLLDFSQLTESSVIYEFGMEFSNGLSGLNSSIYVSDVQYDAGFRNGYDQGKEVAQEQIDNAFNSGYDKGYGEGEDFGFQTGKTVGMNSVSGDTLAKSVKAFAFSLFDAPVNTFMGVFNFEYDGFDIGALVSFIFSIVIVAGILKVVA